MSDTIVDMPKVTQMLDAGWRVVVYKNGMKAYTAEAIHPKQEIMTGVRKKLVRSMKSNQKFLTDVQMTADEAVEESDFHDGYLMTDDFTPEQALTRLAYKVHGEIL